MNVLATASLVDTLGTTQALVAGSTVLAVVMAALFGTGSSRRRLRQERYAVMVATLAGWSELPFRVRRRVADDPATVTALVNRAHQLQEQMVLDAAELSAECPWLARRYEHARRTVQRAASQHLVDAWATPASGTAVSMNLAGWGPTNLDQVIAAFLSELRYRFGWRRAVNPMRLIFNRARRHNVSARVDTTAPSAQNDPTTPKVEAQP